MLKKFSFLVYTINLFVLIPNTTSFAQESNFKVGYHLNSLVDDFGLGLHVVSPGFAKNRLAIKVAGDYQWHRHLTSSAQPQETWTGYSRARIALVSQHPNESNTVRLYSEGGIQAFFLPGMLSSTPVSVGGYGVFGFEFFMGEGPRFFIELGGSGGGASANRLLTNPSIGSGFTAATGFRFSL